MVIYRSTYQSDSDWDEFLKRLRYYDHDTLEFFNGLDLLDSFRMTIFDDRSVFDNASTSFIRDHFKQWVATAPQQEQGTGPGSVQRYRFCIQVDEASLASIVNGPPPEGLPSMSSEGSFKVISKDWEPEELGPDDDPDDFPSEPLEGSTLYDVGWMMVRYSTGMVGMYHYFRNPVAWDIEYHRPPEIALG